MVDEPYRPRQTLYIEFCCNKTGAESMRYAQDSYLRSTWYRKYYTMEVLRHVKSTLKSSEGQIVNALRFNPKVYNPRLLPVDIGRVSIGDDYRGVVFIDRADASDPEMLYCFDSEPDMTEFFLAHDIKDGY